MKINTNYSSSRIQENHQNFGKNGLNNTGLHMDIPKITRKLGLFAGQEAQRVEGRLGQLAADCVIHIDAVGSTMQEPGLNRAIVTVLPSGKTRRFLSKLQARFLGNPVYVGNGFGDALVREAEAKKGRIKP
jgi:hypothetical protein